MPSIDFARYYRPHEVAEALAAFAEEHPGLAAVRSIGTSHEGRDLLLITLTNQASGADTDKPAYWLDANIHATEVTGCMAALHLIQRVLTGYGHEQAITDLLDQRALYVLPCMNPDGMEQALTSPLYVRSGTRRYPYDDDRDGLYPADIDGDGRIVQMRVPDPDGGWKVSDKDPRLMRRRDPDEVGGSYYRVYTEGLIRGYDGYQVKVAPPAQGLDFNRNFPFIWAPEGTQRGAGPYPASEPEIRAVIAFLTSHLNVSGAIAYHTYGGAILRPYSDKADDGMHIEDLWTYKEIGGRGTAITGYRNLSVFHGFRYHPRQVMSGAFDDWAYDQLGIFAFTVELWDMIGEAGIKDHDFIEWFRGHPEEDDLKLLAWNDEQLGGAGFIGWRPFDHPQLGAVEIGGWVERRTFGNPPEQFLLHTIEPNTEFALAHARMGPLLELRHCAAEGLGEGIYRVQVVVANSGYLPTYGSKRAAELGAVRPIEVTLDMPPGAELITGERAQEIGQLEGRANKRALWGASYPTDHLRRLEWTLRAPAGGTLRITAASQRAGTAAESLRLS
ncbi:carboxypeptidase [Oscillochloris sp. ZM17-4]|uniref:M14 family metallopeptidase n=1 Tax=Oscillochloris sp. ZM17-4 TaxID=2866714 RepID=UPI001C737FEB|nr:M14 family metallopeptidase [Oscillochloris sp. ZM17-4]MBX0330371.1 carboxypeptidase [Oscillochloris sp. ZM17-4]